MASFSSRSSGCDSSTVALDRRAKKDGTASQPASLVDSTSLSMTPTPTSSRLSALMFSTVSESRARIKASAVLSVVKHADRRVPLLLCDGVGVAPVAVAHPLVGPHVLALLLIVVNQQVDYFLVAVDAREMERAVARGCGQKRTDNVAVAALARQVQRRVPLHVEVERVGAELQERPDHRALARVGRVEQRRVALDVGVLHPGTIAHKPPDHFKLVEAGRQDERVEPVALGVVDLGLALDQHVDACGVTIHRRVDDRRELVAALLPPVDFGAHVEQQLGRLRPAVLAG
eukprot:scaffold50_cov107-Isochrysis_galbana.AAC.6